MPTLSASRPQISLLKDWDVISALRTCRSVILVVKIGVLCLPAGKRFGPQNCRARRAPKIWPTDLPDPKYCPTQTDLVEVRLQLILLLSRMSRQLLVSQSIKRLLDRTMEIEPQINNKPDDSLITLLTGQTSVGNNFFKHEE